VKLDVGDGRVTLLWDGSHDPAVMHYRVYVGVESGPALPVPCTSNSFMATGLDNGTTYHFSVSAVSKEGGESPRSGVLTATPRALDTRRPVIVATLPVNGSVAVPPDSTLTLRFARPVIPTSLRVEVAPPLTFAQVEWSEGGTRVRLVPAAGLAYATEYTARVEAVDALGQPLDGETLVRFTTAPVPDTAPPTLTSSTPVPGARGVLEDAPFELAFSEPVEPYSFEATLVPESPLGPPVWSENNTRLTLAPLVPLLPDTQYTLLVRARDGGQNQLQVLLNFTTRLPQDITPPSVVSSVPAPGTFGQPVDAPLRIVFSETMHRERAAAALRFTGASLHISWSEDGRSLELLPQQPLAWDSDYTLRIDTGATDLADNALPGAYELKFRTARNPDTTRPQLLGHTPAAESIGASRDTSIRLFFSEPMNAGRTEEGFVVRRGAPLGELVAGTLHWEDGGRQLVFRPQAPFKHGEVVYVRLGEATDLAGNGSGVGSQSWSFRVMRLSTLRLAPARDSWLARRSGGGEYDLNTTDSHLSVGAASYLLAGSWNHRAFLTFDLTQLTQMSATNITRARLLLEQLRIDGNPYSTQLLAQGGHYYALWLGEVEYWQKAEDSVVLASQPRLGKVGALVTSTVQSQYAGREYRGSRVHFRLAFAQELTGNNMVHLGSMESADPAHRPLLEVDVEHP
jgi:methionine-rich copper-binding protein CopC